MSWPDLTAVLEGLPWGVIGAVAARHYMPERMTADIDIAVRAEDGPEVERRLAAAGYRRLGGLTTGGASWEAPTGHRVDVVEGREQWWSEALVQAADNQDAQGLPIVPLPYLVLTKLRTGRVQDVADVTRMLGLAEDSALDQVRRLIADESPRDLDDLESLITLGQLETRPPSGEKGAGV